MATATMPEMKPVEARAEVDSLEALQHKRRELLKDYAPLAAKYKGGRGQGSLADSARKRHRALIMQKILIEMKQEWGKNLRPGEVVGVWKEPSESALERLANAHIDHIAFCQDLEDDVTRYIVLENEVKEIDEKIESRLAEMRFVTSEMRMQS